jgi:WD40 repeat protein
MSLRWTTVVWIAALAAAGVAEDPRPEPKVELKLGVSVAELAVSPDGRWIGAHGSSIVAVLSTEKPGRQVVADFGGPAERPTIAGLLFTQDSRFLVFQAMKDLKSTLHVVDAATAKEVRKVPLASIALIDASPGGSKLLVRTIVAADATILDVATGEQSAGPKLDTGVSSVRASPAGPTAQLTKRTEFGSLSIVDDGAAAPRWTFALAEAAAGAKGSKGPRTSSRTYLRGFTSDAKHFVVVLTWEEGQAKKPREFWRVVTLDAATGKTAWTRDVSGSVVPADGVVAVLGDDGKLDFLDAATGERRWSAPVGEKYVSFTTSPDGRTFWAGTKYGNIVKLSAPAAGGGK